MVKRRDSVTHQDGRIDQALQATKATMGIEGFVITEEDAELLKACLRGDITHEEFLRLAKERAQNA